MKTLIIIPVLLFSLLLGAPSYSADFNKGLTAAQIGDYATAIIEWKPLVEEGNAIAQYNLGLIYDEGLGVPQDYKEAVRLYTLAAKQGHAKAQYNLGLMYRNKQVVPQDYEEAVRLYTLAAEEGFAEAQNNLANRFYYGQGVIEDFVYAHMWKNLASSNGYESAREHLKTFETKMTSSQIEEAQRLARECVKKNYKGC